VAIALDRAGAQADSVTSNMGHLLGTGILDALRAARVAEVLAGPDMSSGFGLRTLTDRSPRFSRLSYHGGTVWPHDTAIAVRGLAREGYVDAAAALTAGLVNAAEGVSYRLPELYGGDQADAVPTPTSYPAACRPQAWAAAAPLACLVAATGLEVNVPERTVRVPDRVSTRLGPFSLHGLRAGATEVTVRVDADGAVTLDQAGPHLELVR
jgi:glycogen debranching enzyme